MALDLAKGEGVWNSGTFRLGWGWDGMGIGCLMMDFFFNFYFTLGSDGVVGGFL